MYFQCIDSMYKNVTTTSSLPQPQRVEEIRDEFTVLEKYNNSFRTDHNKIIFEIYDTPNIVTRSREYVISFYYLVASSAIRKKLKLKL